MKILIKTKYKDGRTYFWHRVLVATSKWSLEWHPHVRVCRYGWYSNWRVAGGLQAQLNLPLLGDFGLWRKCSENMDCSFLKNPHDALREQIIRRFKDGTV